MHENKKDYEKNSCTSWFWGHCFSAQLFSFYCWTSWNFILDYLQLQILQIFWEKTLTFFTTETDPLSVEYLKYYVGWRATITLQRCLRHSLGNWIPVFKTLLLVMFNYLYKTL